MECSDRLDGRKNTPLLCLTLGMAPLGVSWAGRLRVRHSHDGLASGRASETRGCPLAGRDLHGNPLHTDLCFWRLLLALCAIATPEAVLGECVAVLLRPCRPPQHSLCQGLTQQHNKYYCTPALPLAGVRVDGRKNQSLLVPNVLKRAEERHDLRSSVEGVSESRTGRGETEASGSPHRLAKGKQRSTPAWTWVRRALARRSRPTRSAGTSRAQEHLEHLECSH